ncbi:MAG: hypothetical protein AVDCRST_MAG72-1827 [uncultured Nocardioidaceae bacterium]|uniref:ANTAR domain-containing protein n=1 Tax=uncultured Nocardioidaceae bacterium TaxID=253824 RepID=A0A6J4MDI4_9ACTN|nr:MAG: hypothetical protein AVDCRST_MAG72-1827 [uncultured Nocardioidaceae bacterium]
MEQDSLSERMAELARDLRSVSDPGPVMQSIVEATAALIPADMVAVTFVDEHGGIETPASSDPRAARGDELQYELSEGPCLDAVWRSELVTSDDLAAEPRWPTWSARVVEELGVRSMLCMQLFTHERTLGALNLYGGEPRAFSGSQQVEAVAIAAHAAVAVASATKISNLDRGLARRTVVGQATGILMERFDLDAAQAFSILTRVSGQESRKVFDIATSLVLTRETPGT